MPRFTVWRRSLPIEALTMSAALLLSAGLTPRNVSAAPQEEEEEEEVEVKPPELLQATVRSPEPVCARPSTVVCEDFERPNKDKWSDYEDRAFYVDNDRAFSGKQALKQTYERDQVMAGWLGWFFGDHPEGGVRSGQKFEEIHFRFYHRFQKDWPDSYPVKFVRVQSHYAGTELRFAWEEQLYFSATLPHGTPVSRPISRLMEPAGTRYQNDLRWLEKEPLDLRFAELDGEWLAIEMRVKLNTPGLSDGRITYWVDEKVVLDREGLNLRGAYTATTINAVMLEGYWNSGSPRDGLKRWYDNVVVATEPVGCAVFMVRKKELDEQSGWQLQIATTADPAAVVWDSGTIEGEGVEIDIAKATGTFAPGTSNCLRPSLAYVMRARQAVGDTWSEWSEWQPMF